MGRLPLFAGRGRLLGALAVAALIGTPLPAEPAAAAAAPSPGDVLRRVQETFARHEPAQAAEILRELEGGELADHAGLLRARLLVEAGELDAALEAGRRALERNPPSEVRASIHAELARIHLRRQDLLAAYGEFRRASETTYEPETAAANMVALAEAFEARRMPGDALLLYRSVWERWPLAPEGLLAFERSERLRRATGAPQLDASVHLARADQLRRAYRCEPALDSYEAALELAGEDPQLRLDAERGRATCLFQRQRYLEAAEAFAALAKATPRDPEPEINRARALARLGENREAAAEFARVAGATNGHLQAYARYLEAIVLRKLDPARYRALLLEIEKQKDSPTYAGYARWRLAWEDVEGRRWPQAERRLTPLAQGSLSDIEVQRARYWLARVRAERASEQGRAGLEELAREIPLSFYGLLAAEQLGRPPEVRRPLIGARTPTAEDRAHRRARWLLEGGFSDQARDELRSRLFSGRLSREERVTSAELLLAAGSPYRAVRVLVDGFGDTLEQGVDPNWEEVWRLAWPRPWPETVSGAAREFGFEPALVYAVMREESTYRPEVESPVGARGLMQIMPPTGARIARALGVDEFDPKSLYSAETNVRFGTYYLTDLLRRFEGSKPLAIAAYNAGPEAVSGWIERDEPVVLDRFVDSVPYSETRRYLRKVLRSYHVYQLLYGERTAETAQSGAASGR